MVFNQDMELHTLKAREIRTLGRTAKRQGNGILLEELAAELRRRVDNMHKRGFTSSIGHKRNPPVTQMSKSIHSH